MYRIDMFAAQADETTSEGSVYNLHLFLYFDLCTKWLVQYFLPNLCLDSWSN